MKKKTLLTICSCAAALFTMLIVLTKYLPNLFSSLVSFPFEQIAYGLSLLSKAGSVGNGFAVALWIGISAIPAIIALRYENGKESMLERVSLYILSGTILLALYGMVNPLLFRSDLSDGFSEYPKMIKGILGTSIWAVVVLCIMLRLIRLFRRGDKEKLLKYMQAVLCALCIIFAAIAAVSLVDGVISLFAASQTGIDKGFGIVLLVAELIPYLFDIAIIIRVLKLSDIASREEQEDIVEAANQVSSICCMALGLTTAITAAINIIQIAMMRWLSNINVTVNIPVVSIAFTVMILLFSRLLIENKSLRDDNNLFI